MLANNKVPKAVAILIKICALGYSSILLFVIISNLSIFNPNWPFGLFASFSSLLIIMLPLVLGTLLIFWRKIVPFIVLLALVAFYPFYTFTKMIRPSNEACDNTQCVSIVAANLRHDKNALRKLATTKAKDADILIIVEFPYSMTSDELLALFPMNDKAQIALMTNPNLELGSRIAVMSQKPLNELKLQIESFPVSKVWDRGIVKFNYSTESGSDISFVVLHPPPPKQPAAMASRDAYFKAASQTLHTEERFVMIGDFNVTPWEPIFDELPGKRAGDPRWARTWNARNFVERITIDHALLGNEIDLVEFNILEDVGSDHFPIHLIIHPQKEIDRNSLQ